jgi:hypothetical protein
MALMSIGNEVAFNFQKLVPVDLPVPVLRYIVLITSFVYARHVTNQHWEAEFMARAELDHALRELRLMQGRLVQSERMAAIDRLTG